MRYLTIFMGLLFCALFGSNRSGRGVEPKVRIGVIGSFSGIAAEHGLAVQRGIMLAAEKLADIQVIFEDDQTEPAQTLAAYRRLKLAGVDAIIGSTWSHTTNAVAPLATKDKTTLVSTSNLPESLSFDEWNFNTAWSVHSEAEPFRRYLTLHRPQRVTFLHNLTTWGEIQIQTYREIAEAAGTQFIETFSADNGVDWDTLLPKILTSNPDLIVLILNKGEIDQVVRSPFLKGKRLFGSINTHDAIALGNNSNSYENICFPYPYRQLVPTTPFGKEYQRRFGRDPELYSNVSYDTLLLLAQGLKESRRTVQPLQDILRNLSFTGSSGTYKFSKAHSLAVDAKIDLLCVRGGIATVVPE